MKSFMLVGLTSGETIAPADRWFFADAVRQDGPEPIMEMLYIEAPDWAEIIGTGYDAELDVGAHSLIASEAVEAAWDERYGLSVECAAARTELIAAGLVRGEGWGEDLN